MGGAVDDHISARKIMIATASRAPSVFTVIGVLVWLRILRTWKLYALAFAFWVVDAFCRSCASGLTALASEARTTGRGIVGQAKHGADDHHC
jgi:hypothetical protein